MAPPVQMAPPTTPGQRLERLRQLRELLRTLAEEPRKAGHPRFSMSAWGRYADPQLPEEPHPCRTAACALGHAALDPWFRARGMFMFTREAGTKLDLATATDLARALAYRPGMQAHIGYYGEIDTAAGAVFFGIQQAEAENLFLPERYYTHPVADTEGITPREVMRRVEAMILLYERIDRLSSGQSVDSTPPNPNGP